MDEGRFSVGYENWNKRNPLFTTHQAMAAALPIESLPILRRVNDAVNSDIHYSPDVGGDHWDVVPSSGPGDCDDYVVTKLARLVAAGVPRSALRVVVTTTGHGTLHLVLGADIGETTVILDNLKSDVEPWTERTDLTFKVMEIVNKYGYAYLATLRP